QTVEAGEAGARPRASAKRLDVVGGVDEGYSVASQSRVDPCVQERQQRPLCVDDIRESARRPRAPTGHVDRIERRLQGLPRDPPSLERQMPEEVVLDPVALERRDG